MVCGKYTGANRCPPCTIVNVFIAGGLSTALAWWLTLGLGIASFGIFLATIYLRGYLIPGTPTLTKRYLPDPIFDWVAKHKPPHAQPPSQPTAATAEPDEPSTDPSTKQPAPDAVLQEIGALAPCEHENDLCLTDEFAADWHDRITAMRGDDYTVHLGHVLDQDTDGLRVETDEGCLITDGGNPLVSWESEAALLADLAAASTLAERHLDWDDLETGTKGKLLQGLRVFLEDCPVCEAPLAFREQSRELCCGRTTEFLALQCKGCNASLMDIEARTSV